MREQQTADNLLSVDRITRAKRNYKQMKLQSITIPVKERSAVNNEQLAERGRQRLKAAEEAKR